MRWYLRYPISTERYMEWAGFAVCRTELVDVYFVGGFGMVGWVTASNYARAQRTRRAVEVT